MKDDLSDVEAGTIDELLYIGAGEIANLRTVLGLGWLQDEVSEAEYDVIGWLSALNYEHQEAVATVIAMPFLKTLERDDVLAIRAMYRLAYNASLSSLLAHPTVQDGITDEETLLTVAAGTLQDLAEAGRMLEPGYSSVKTVAQPTERTPTLNISIVRTETEPVPGTVELVVEAVEFVEDLMQQPLPIEHVILVLDEDAVIEGYAGTNRGFPMTYLPTYEQADRTFLIGGQDFRVGIAHEVAHYYWRSSEDWVDEGMASTIEYMYGVARGLVRSRLINQRRDCEAHDLQMLLDEDPDTSNSMFHCNYYLGQGLFLELLESMDDDEAFGQKVSELYLLAGTSLDTTSPIDLVRQYFKNRST